MLGCRVKDAPKHQNVNLIRHVSFDELKRFHIATNQLSDYRNYCVLYEMCDKNYSSIILYLLSMKDEFPKHRHRLHEYSEESLQEIDRLLLNYLSSFRTFLDHLETRYKRLQKQDSSFLDDYKKMVSACYDSSFPYRFFYKLRDYVQHCGMPPTSINIIESPGLDGSIDTIISVRFDRDGLINGYKRWRKIRDELQRQPPYMEFPPYIKALRLEIQRIHVAMSGIELSLASDSWQYLYKLVREVQDKYGAVMPFIGRKLTQDGGELQLKMEDFPLHIMAKFQADYKKIQDFQEQQKTKKQITE